MPKGVNKVSLKPPSAVVANYKRGLKMHEDGKTGSGIEAGTIKVARDIASGGSVTEDWVRKANRFWGRNNRFLQEPEDSPAYASALLWGGAAGRDWYASTLKKLEKANSADLKTGMIRANIRNTVNSAQIREEKRDGRDVIIVPSYTLPDDVIMNGILYPAAEIEKSYKTLEGTPAPLGHPTVNDMFVSAKSPLGLNIGYFGAFNANVTRFDGRVFIEKVIDVERASESEMGRRVLSAIKEGKPVHTSTGLLMNIRECTESDMADWTGSDFEFDHDAILLDETGAATPEQGVGMMVNDGGSEKRIQVINSDLTERNDDYIDSLGMELLAALDRKEVASRWERMKEAIMETIGLGGGSKVSEPERMEATEMDAEELKKALEGVTNQLTELSGSVSAANEKIDGLQAKVEANDEVINSIKADRESARAEMINKVVEAELMSEDDAKAATTKSLEVMINSITKKADVKPAPGVFAGFNKGSDEKHSLAEDWEK